MIGSILISPECLPVAAGILSPGDFGLEANRQLFQAALALTRAGKPADPVLLGQEVRRMGGSVSNEYIMQLMDATPTAANVEEYARLTRENSVARGIRDAYALIAEAGFRYVAVYARRKPAFIPL